MVIKPVCIIASLDQTFGHPYMVQIVLDSLKRGEYPYFFDSSLSLAMLTELTLEQRQRCLVASIARSPLSDRVVVYNDHGVNESMRREILRSEHHRADIEYRRLPQPEPMKMKMN